MSSEIDPFSLTPSEVNKISKKDLAKHLTTLQGMHKNLGKKYGA
jgi:hypothetical protein